jgi:hypothetical protein
MEVILDSLESRFDKLSRKYLNDQTGVRMKSWQPSQVVSKLHMSPLSKYDEPEFKSELT